MKKFAFVTGAGGYIGSEVASVLARAGMSIAVCDINEESVSRTVEKIIAGVVWLRAILQTFRILPILKKR